MILSDRTDLRAGEITEEVKSIKATITHAKADCCFDNVMEKIKRSGNGAIPGWTFRMHRNPEFGAYLAATHHCVWMAPDRTLIDVTPFNDDELLRPLTENGNAIFLIDMEASPVVFMVNNTEITAPLPDRFFPLSDDEKLLQYIAAITEQERRECEEIYAGRIPEGRAVIR